MQVSVTYMALSLDQILSYSALVIWPVSVCQQNGFFRLVLKRLKTAIPTLRPISIQYELTTPVKGITHTFVL